MSKICNIKKILILIMAVASMMLLAVTTAFAEDYKISGYEWNDNYGDFMAEWEDTTDATTYKIQLFKGNVYDAEDNIIYQNQVTKALATSKEYYDFTDTILDEGAGTYRFILYAVKDDETVYQSDALQVTYDMIECRKKTVGWHKIDGYWYYFKETPVTANASTDGPGTGTSSATVVKTTVSKATGWIFVDNAWYYLDSHGRCYLNAWTPDHYFVDANGVWNGQPAVVQ